jgi:ATPase subunit of ABC transporter with duplicated ATPase domains
VHIGYFSQDVGEMSGRSAVVGGDGRRRPGQRDRRRDGRARGRDGRSRPRGRAWTRSSSATARCRPFDELDGYALDGRAREVLAGLGFADEMMEGDVGKLSGGWKMRVALARILLMRPTAMLLDEPSNHLDIESLIWLENFLKGL